MLEVTLFFLHSNVPLRNNPSIFTSWNSEICPRVKEHEPNDSNHGPSIKFDIWILGETRLLFFLIRHLNRHMERVSLKIRTIEGTVTQRKGPCHHDIWLPVPATPTSAPLNCQEFRLTQWCGKCIQRPQMGALESQV